ncbi:MAG: carboxypeptidase regulatory-like domain-containing protein [Bryobacteraceae bacterium]|nr:carboxypeptidase regulatory-like domain-containing protein [Bryobacteraceae bacterium]
MWRLAAILAVASAHPASGQAVLSVRVLDAETGAVMPATLRIETAAGSVITESAGFREGVRSPGLYRTELPPGPAAVTVSRGFDYGAERRRIELPAGEERELTISLRRRSPLRREGWFAGDNHVHMVHGEALVHATFADLERAARAEGLDYLSVAQAWNLPEPTAADLSEVCARHSRPDFQMQWNLETPKNYWRGDASHCMGHGWTLGMRDRTADGKDPIAEFYALNAHDFEKEKTPAPNFDTHALVHDLGGFVSYTHPTRWWRGDWGGRNGFPAETGKFISNLAQELPFDTIAGPTYDSIDILMQPHEREVNRLSLQLWYMLLNRGYRLAGTGSSDATFDRPGGAVPGKVRIYTRLEGDFSFAKAAEAMRAGRNFVTSGPLLTFEIDGRPIGDTITIQGPAKLRVHVRAWAAPDPASVLREIELVRNGDVIRRLSPAAAHFDSAFEIEESNSAWYVVRCIGDNDNHVALANPIYVERGAAERPSPVPANVSLEIVDAQTRQPVTGSVAVIRRVGREERVLRNLACPGACSFTAPATARLRIGAGGYAPEDRSVFLDTPELLDPAVNAKVEDILDWTAYERVRRALGRIRFTVALRPEGSDAAPRER